MPLVPIQWLGAHVELPAELTPEELAQALVKVGLEEETIHEADIQGPVVVGKVLTREPKEQSNGKVINYCRVDVGEYNDEPGTGKEPSDLPSRGIICGAHNFEAGDYVVVSLPGAVLPGGFAIAARKTYGHTSDGMICSAAELGLPDDSSHGIIVLAKADDEEAKARLPKLGSDALPLLGIGGRTLEINITPDRGYCFSMRGVAREYHHSTGAAFTDPGIRDDLPTATADAFVVEVNDEAPIHGVAGCDRFVTRIVRGVDPKAPSPKWLQDRLTQAGMRPISLAVDATNYVMLDLGQPLHAYDLDKVEGPIVVRRAKDGEKLVTLDDVERELDPEDLLITDCAGGHGARILGLAGVMGGADTEITDDTTNVLIEAAHFEPVSIARTARRHKLPSEAAKRFERGVDPLLPAVAAQAVVDLLVEYGGGTAGSEVGDLNNVAPVETQDFPVAEVARLTGLDVPGERIRAILVDIGCRVDGDGDVLKVTPPTWRPDLVGPAHFVEEIARLVGYDEIPSIFPAVVPGRGLTASQRQRRDAMTTLAETGWVEVLSYPFVGDGTFDKQGIASDDERRVAVRLANPLQEDAPYLRTSLLDTLLDTAKLNVARSNPTLAIVESGVVARPSGIVAAVGPAVGSRPSEDEISALTKAIPAQPLHIAGVAAGPRSAAQFGYPVENWDWRDAIDAVLSIGRTIGLDLDVAQGSYAPFHPGRCAEISSGGKVVGYAGELAPAVCKAFDLPKRAIAFEVNADAIFAARGSAVISVDPVLTSPVAKEDIALVVDESVTVRQVHDVIVKAAGSALEDVRLFDIYTGEQVDDGKKSLAFALRFRSDHTLKADETAGLRKKILKQAQKKLGATLRA
ncbi:phenylalanine--tRNA ligase subunit beta [Arcanobacterium haemolyticum]|nr:phenylalanine--tRNA ligase subunit beta [Arcanobacterium haemolyticum]